jgi:Spy/CpxP family protein refolding chaperone
MHFAFALKGLDLTPQQSAQLDPLLKARHDEAEAGRSAADAARHALGDQIRADVFDDSAIRARAAAVAAFEADRAVADAALLRDVRAVLTPGQRDELDQRLQPPPGEGPRDGGVQGGPAPGNRPKPPIETALDANGDGVIDAAEIANAAVALKKLDKNGDGKLTPGEYHPPHPPRPEGPGR